MMQENSSLDDAVKSLVSQVFVSHCSNILDAPCPALGQPIQDGGDPNSPLSWK